MRLTTGVFSGDGDPTNDVDPVFHDNDEIKYVVEVYRKHPEPVNVYKGVREVELVKPGGTLVNVGAGPVLPTNPYEGQVWILT